RRSAYRLPSTPRSSSRCGRLRGGRRRRRSPGSRRSTIRWFEVAPGSQHRSHDSRPASVYNKPTIGRRGGRMRALLLTLSLSTLGLGGCVVVHDTTPAGPPTYRIQLNAATIISPGTVAGFGITAAPGGSFRLVFTGDAAATLTYRNFTGSVLT